MLYVFDDYRLDIACRELRRSGAPVPLEPQVFDLLAYLIRNRDRVVSRDDLIEAIWNGRSISESALNSRINAARSAIGDNGDEQRLIRTFPRKGLRFVASAREEAPGAFGVEFANVADFLNRPSIAVLAFTNMSGDAQQDYFADGMSEDITTALSKVRWFLVVSRNSAFSYKGKAVDVKQIGRELGVRYVLEGSVRRAGGRVRITVQLLDATTGHHVWAERYDRDLADTFAVQDEITEQVVAAIEPRLYAAEGVRSKRKPPENLDAWECVVRALGLIDSREKHNLAEAEVLLRKAIALDPGYAQAYSLLSFASTLAIHMGWGERGSTIAAGRGAAQKAMTLDANDPWAHVALGYVLAWERRAEDAVLEYKKALALNPNFAVAHWLMGLAYCYLGKADDAFVHGDIAERLSPSDLLSRGNSGVSNNVRALACFVGARYREGVDYSRRAIAESPNLTPAYRTLIANCALAGDIEDAKAALAKLRSIVPDISLAWIATVVPYVREDDRQRYLRAFKLAGLT